MTKQSSARALLYCDLKEIVTESFVVTDMTAVTSAMLFRSESRAAVSTPMTPLNVQVFICGFLLHSNLFKKVDRGFVHW